MAITTNAQLQTAVASWLDVTATDISSQIDDLIMIGEKRIFREARTRDMETAISSTIASGVVALPASYVALKNARLDLSPVVELERRSSAWIYQNYGYQTAVGIPSYIARDGQNFIFGPYPDSAYVLKGIYYTRPTAIATTVTPFFTANPDLYLMAALAEAEPLIGRDPRIAVWNAKYAEILANVNGEDKTEDASGSPLQSRVGTNTSWSGRRQW